MKSLISLIAVILFSISAIAEVKCPRDNNNGSCSDGTPMAQMQVPAPSAPGQTDCPACANPLGWSGDLLKTATYGGSTSSSPSGSTVIGE